MYRDYKIVAVTPAGRQRYLELLLQHMLKNRDIIDRWSIWCNTQVQSDKDYIYGLAQQYPDFIEVKETTDLDRAKNDPTLIGSNNNIRYFFKDCTDIDTIYVRFDDDIVWLEPNGLEGFLDYRIDHPEYLIVYPLIINNCGISYVLQELDIIRPQPQIGGPNSWPGNHPEFFRGGYHPLDRMGWENVYFAQAMHEWLLNAIESNRIKEIKFPEIVLSDYQYVAINCFAWFGADFAQFDGIVDADNEEGWFNLTKPQQIGKVNAIYGEWIVSHFAFYCQRQHLDSTNLLARYKELCS